MCGIVGAVATRDVLPILIDGLQRLEYRGYDSAGVAVLTSAGQVTRLRTVGKVARLREALDEAPTAGMLGIAHTRWATHGVPSERNAHPHISRDGIAIVHNGIIENHEELRADLTKRGYAFTSETDTEVIAHRVHFQLQSHPDLFAAVQATVRELHGAYALAVMSSRPRTGGALDHRQRRFGRVLTRRDVERRRRHVLVPDEVRDARERRSAVR